MALRKALGWAGAQTAVRMVLAFFSAKVSAVYLGPPGMALVGQLNSFLQLAQGAVGNGTQTGVVNLTAKWSREPARLRELWGTALRLALALAGVVALAATLFSVQLASALLGDGGFWPVVVLAAVAILFLVFDGVVLSVLNGLKRVDTIAKAGIASSVADFCVFALLVYAFGLWGGLVGIAAICLAKPAISCALAFQSGAIRWRDLAAGGLDGGIARDIARFYPMLLVHSIAQPLAQLLVRDTVIEGLGLEQAGYLQAVWRLSEMYVGVMTTALGLYFMSHYSALKVGERASMVRRTMLQLMALTALAATLVYLLRDVVIHVVLTPRFMPMGDLLPAHLAGDVVKMMNYPLQMALVSERRSAQYMVQAALGPAVFVLLAHALLPSLGAQAAPTAYAASHLVVFALLITLHVAAFRRGARSASQ